MTVAVTDTFVIHQGNGAATNFPYSFRIPDAAFARVYIRDAETHEVTEELDPADYTITGTTWANYSGGVVTYNPGTPLSADYEIVIERDPDYLQGLDLNNQGGFYAESLEQALDLAAMQIQDLKQKVDRAVVLPLGDEGEELPYGSGDTLYTSVNTLAGIADEIEAVANNNADISTVADNLNGPNTIGTVAQYETEVNAVGDNIAAVIAVNADEADIGTVASDLNGADTIGTVANNIIEVAAVGDNIAAVLNADANMAAIIDAPNQATLARLYAISDTDAPISGAVSVDDRGAKFYADISEENSTNVGNMLAQQAAQMVALQILFANAFNY